MTERIDSRDRRGRLEPLEEERFAKEDELQALIAEHPEVLDGEQMRPGDPLRWILITREQGIAESSSDAATRWSVDHLIVDQDAVPTLVEVKRGSNPADGEPDADGFWERVATNLAATRLRLLFVADDIPDALERVVEFLNAQMAGIEVLAVEIKQFKGHSSPTLVPRVIGRTAASPGPVGRRSRLDREYSNGVAIQIRCSLWKRPVGVTWLFPPSQWGKAVLRG